MDRSPDYMLECLAKEAGLRSSELAHVTFFRAFRTRRDGAMQEVDIKILDAGPGKNPAQRFFCQARTDDGKFATGNPADSVENALTLVHWAELDSDP